uniref:Putative sigma-70 region domain containing protein n=1 Tax=viral metagenome TaxID=1070528 RepID=A0A6M3JN34_9ZZZZ
MKKGVAGQHRNIEMESLIRDIRLEKGLTIEQLSDLAEIKPSYVSCLQNGLLSPIYLIGKLAGRIKPGAQKIADALDVPVESLFPRYFCEIARNELLESQLLHMSLSGWSVSPLSSGIKQSLELAMSRVLKSLGKRQDEIIRRRFGLYNGDERPQTYREISDLLGRSHERIRQLEAKALRRLRHPSRATKLRHFIET